MNKCLSHLKFKMIWFSLFRYDLLISGASSGKGKKKHKGHPSKSTLPGTNGAMGTIQQVNGMTPIALDDSGDESDDEFGRLDGSRFCVSL